MALLEIENIHKNFGKTEVLKGISFSLEKGEVYTEYGVVGYCKTNSRICIYGISTSARYVGISVCSAKYSSSLNSSIFSGPLNSFPAIVTLNSVRAFKADLLLKYGLSQAYGS